MSTAETSLDHAILDWMKAHGVRRGQDCPVLKVSLAGYGQDGIPVFEIRAAYDTEIQSASQYGSGLYLEPSETRKDRN